MVDGIGGRHGTGFAELVDLYDIGDDPALNRLPEQAAREGGGQAEASECHQTPVPRLHAGGADPIVPELTGSLEMPTGLVRGAALFAHCFTCTKQSRAAVSVARALSREGIACLRFDFTGLGGSEGDFGRAGFATDVADLVAAAEDLLRQFAQPILMVGHSLGGAAVLAAADDLGFDKVAAIATIGAPSDVPHVLARIEGDIDAIRE